MDLRALQVKALGSVLKPDYDYLLRKVYRWFSRTYATPLDQAYEIPIEEVLQAWFEERYEGMDEADREEEKVLLFETDRERAVRQNEEDRRKAEDEDALLIVQASVLKQEEKEAKKKGEIAPTVPGAQIVSIPKQSLLNKPLPPDIKMTFLDPEEFESSLEGLGDMDEPKK